MDQIATRHVFIMVGNFLKIGRSCTRSLTRHHQVSGAMAAERPDGNAIKDTFPRDAIRKHACISCTNTSRQNR